MSIKQQTHLYEILIRFDENGFAGAHQISVEKYTDSKSGAVLSEKQGNPQALTAAKIKGLLSKKTEELLLKIAALEKKLEKTELTSAAP